MGRVPLEANTADERRWRRLALCRSAAWTFLNPVLALGGALAPGFNLARCLRGSSVGGYIYIKWSY